MRPTPALIAHAEAALGELLRFARPADQALSAYFRSHRNLGQHDRAFVAETAFAVLRRRRSLEAAAGSAAPHALVVAALVRVFGLSGRALEADAELVARVKAAARQPLAPAVQVDLPRFAATVHLRHSAAKHGQRRHTARFARELGHAMPWQTRSGIQPASGSRGAGRLNSGCLNGP